MCFFCLEKMQQNNTDPAVLDDVFDLWKEREIFKTYYDAWCQNLLKMPSVYDWVATPRLLAFITQELRYRKSFLQVP